jgi:hypothetical protein
MAKTNLMHVVAMEIEQATALPVLDPPSPTTLKQVEAGSGEGLAQKVSGILLQQPAGGTIDVALGPPGAVRGLVKIPLGIHARGGHGLEASCLFQ